MKPPKRILPIIVIAQFCCTSLWFAGNGVMDDLTNYFGLENTAMGHLTASVQLGFIVGTLLFALLTIADRFPPSRVFFISALLGAFFNLGSLLESNQLFTLSVYRFLTGFFLAGVYPVGMKIAADYYEKGLGKSLGYLLGALVLGTAFPHLLKGWSSDVPWKQVIMVTSILAVLGGFLMLLWVPNGPYRKSSTTLKTATLFKVFNQSEFRASALGYFGHMWELYAFWAFVPVMLVTYQNFNPHVELNIAALSFVVIAAGGIACVLGGYLSQKVGVKPIAMGALLLSCICCLSSPFFFSLSSPYAFMGFLIFWGMAVIADSPMFSTLVAMHAPAESKGTALTVVNSIGFAITIVSIQLLNTLQEVVNPRYLFVVLAIGPVFGVWAISRRK